MNNPKQVTINQLTALMDFLEEHPALALGQFQRSKEGRCLSRRLWEQCALALNALEAGSTRDAEGWREYFKAYKARFKKILSNHQKSLNATGGGPPAVLQLTPLQERLHAILGVDMGEPLPGVQHNPLSQTLTTEGTPLLAADSPSGSENVIVYCPVSSGVSVFDIDLPWAAESIPEPEGVQAPELALFEPDMALAPNPPLAPESAPAPAAAPIFGEGVPTSALTTTPQPAEARQRRRRRRPRTPLDEPATELAAAQARLERLEAEAAAATREVAAATREVAAATREVAAATREDAAHAHRIATALERIATAMENESRPRKRRRRRISSSEVLLLGARITASLFVIHVVIVPLVFKYSKAFRRILIFANFVQWPFIIPEPNKCGLVGARNLSVKYKSKVDNCSVKIGVWHVLPKTAYERLKDSFEDDVDKTILDKEMDEELASGRHPVVMYCHGNANNRATAHRAILYKLFQDMDYHTITFDYRGYGDSTRINPTEAGVVEDSLKVYEWLLNTAHKYNDNTPVFIWGHSLGTGISSALLGNLTELSRTKLNREVPLKLPNGLILEAPFNNIADEVHHYPLSKLVAWLPYYEMTIVEPFRAHAEQRFRSDVNLTLVRDLPIMILHAKDDTVVPFLVGRKLYKSIVLSRTKTDAPVVFHAYEKKENLGHKYICLAKDLQEVVGDFVKKHQERK